MPLRSLNILRKEVMGKHTFKQWFTATRPWSFPASAMPVAVTLAYLLWNGQEVNWVNGVWALLNIVVFHAAGNTWSDYFDFKYKVDAKDTFGAKFLTDGMFAPKEIFRLAMGLLIVAVAGGLALAWRTGWELLAIGAAGAVGTLLYPALKYRAWGDVDILLTYALLPTLGTCFVATGGFSAEALLVTLSSGLITVSILHANNTRDVATDHRAGIRTLAMNLGHTTSVCLYLAEVLLPYLIVPICAAVGVLPWWTMMVVLSLPMSLSNCKLALRSQKEGCGVIAGLDELSAKLQLVFNLLLTVGLVIAALIV